MHKIASDNQRIIKLFGSKDIDLALVNSSRKGLKERLRKEHEHIVDHEQSLDFVDRRANQIRISPRRSIRITDPAKQLGKLFAELVVEELVQEILTTGKNRPEDSD